MWQVHTNPEVDMFLDSFDISTRNKIRYVVHLLEEYGYLLRTPHSKKIAGYTNLFELRTSGESPVRLFYTLLNNKSYILHGFIKKTGKTPLNEIKTAVNRIKLLTIV